MNKGLEALEQLCDLANCGDLYFHVRHDVWTRLEGVNKYKPIIETELKRLEALDLVKETIKPTPIKQIDNYSYTYDLGEDSERFNMVFLPLNIYQEIKIKLEKQDKILQIIKEKKVNVNNFIVADYSWRKYKEAVAKKYTIVKEISNKPLTKEEFELLKEYFE